MGTEPLRAHVNESDSNENSDSENSGSCSYSSSSDSECGVDGKSSAARNRHRNRKPATQFSVTQSCHTGLKLKIAAVPRDPLSLTNKTQTKSANKSEDTKVKVSPKKPVDTDTKKRSVKKKKKKSNLSESTTSSDSCSDCSGSRCSSDDEDLGTVARRAARQRSRLANKQAATSNKKSATPTKNITTPTKSTTTPTKNATTPTKSTTTPTKSATTPNKNATNAIKNSVTTPYKNAVTTIKPAATVNDETIITVTVPECKTKTVPNVKVSNVSAKTKTKSEESSPAKSLPAKLSPVKSTPVKRGRGRPPAKLTSAGATIGAEVSCVGTAAAFSSPSSTSSSSSSSSSSPSSSSSDSDSPDTAAGGSANGSSASDDSSAALAAACSLQVIDEEDLAALLPEEPPPAPIVPASFAPFAPPAEAEDDKSMDNGDGSSSEMELTPQLVSAAIQRATADSSDNECSNSGVTHSTATHYASSLLQEFVAQTQMLSSTAMTPISTPMENVPLDQNVLSQITSLPEINPITPNFLTTEHLSGQHLSPQQTEELSQINKDLEEIGAVTDSLPIHPPSLDDCVDNSEFMQLDISHTNSDLCSSNLLKSSAINLPLLEIASTSALNENLKTDLAASSVDSQDETKSTTTERRRPGRPRKTPKVKKETDRSVGSSQAVKNNNLDPLNNVINEFCPNEPPNVSPDSGILSNHNSPAHSPLGRTIDHNPRIELLAKENEVRERRGRSRSQARRKNLKEETTLPTPKPQLAKPDKVKRIDHKLDIASLDRMLYATDRVLYPPRRKAGRPPQNKNPTKRGPGRPHKIASSIDSGDSDNETRANRNVLSEVYAKRRDLNKLASLPKKGNRMPDNSWRDHQSDNEVGPDDPLDPTWRQIDLNPKYKDILSGYKSDHDVKPYKSCSRLIESGYKSDYGCRSGYKSDHRSGYKSDHRSGYKSDKGGYKTDHSVRSMRRRMRKLKKSRSVRDQSYYKNQKYFVSDQEILVLAKKTFSCLSLGQASDSEAESGPPIARDFVSASAKYKVLSTRKQNNFINNSDPFAPAPVFSGFNARVSPSLGKFNLFQTLNSNSFSKTPFKPAHLNNLLSGSKSAFTHKFACPPMCTTIDKALPPGRKKDYLVNNNNIKSTRNNSPKHKKGLRNTENNFPMFSREKSPEVATNVFEKARNIYIPNEDLARNIFLNLKKTQKKVAISARRPRKPFIIAPSKITLKPTCRLSRISPKLESRHHRHKTKRRHRRSRSVSRSRDLIKPDDTVDQKFCQEVETLANHFLKHCHIAPKCTSQQSVKAADKAISENAKCLKRVSKKRKVSDNTELTTPSSKRRHKKQLADAQAKEPGANEHKLPLKKRHYHVNSCTSNPLSLSLVATGEKDQAQEHSFLCTETDCMGTGDSHTKTKSSEKVTHDTEQMLKTIKSGISTTVESLTVQIDEAIEACISRYNSPNSVHSTDDETLIKKPTGEHSELSKKIYETSEKLKAVHKMVHDLEKSLPKNENCELVTKDSKIDSAKGEMQKTIPFKLDTKNTTSSGTLLTKNVPIVTPKKRHRIESDKIVSNSSLDLVVQSLSRKLLDDKVSGVNSTPGSSPARHSTHDTVRTPDNKQSSDAPEPVKLSDPKSVSARTLCKGSIQPSHKSEIMTRKKNRLEGLTSNLVSKMNPSTATKVLDTLMNNNIRQSIESRMEKGKSEGLTDVVKVQEEKVKSGKDSGPINTRATVIKSPSTKSKPPDAKKQKNTDIISEQVVVVNIDKPTGIFEPSVDIEMQIPKSSISTMTLHSDKAELVGKNKHKLRSGDNKSNQKLTRPSLDGETEIPLSLIAKQIDGVLTRPKRSESIASVISDKIQETTGGHNLRHSKRNLTSDSEINLMEDINEKKKKKLTSNILRECKFVLPPQILHAKVQVEKIALPNDIKKTEVEKLAINNGKTQTVDTSVDNAAPMKKKVKRRKVNRTGFPSLKKKKKKLPAQAVANPDLTLSSLPRTDTHSAFDRVPKHGETMHTFLERTATKKASEIKVPLNKEHCSRQGRLSVISLERLQGKNALDNNNIPVVKLTDIIKPGTPIHTANNTVTNLNLNLFKGLVKNFSDSNAINKWEVLSETDSIPSMTPSSLGNDPEDSIPLSLLNLKPERPPSRLDRADRLKRKTLERSPSQEFEEIALAKQIPVNNNIKRLRSKSSLGLYCPGDRRSTRSNDRLSLEAEDVGVKNLKTHIVNKKLLSDKFENKILRPALLNQHRKSRTNQRKIRDCTPSSRESSLDTLKSIKLSPASRDTSVDTLRRSHCFENDPLPLQEKELDFEKSIDLLSKNVISKKRMASSRDDSPASSVERAKGTAPGKRNPRLRKKYLVAGLFSQYYKDDDPKPADPKLKASLNSSECPRGLLSPPPYCERWVRQRKQHFTLPYDVWWQHQYSQPVPSWNYRKIRTNVYYDVKPSSYGCESQACNCLPASGCQDDCINRMVYAECEAQHCPCKELCKNQRIQKHEWATGLEKFMTESKGWGVRSKESIPSGEFILEYVGEVVSDREFKERMASRYARDTHHYCLHLDGGLVIDGHRMGGDGRFVNHSCQPNCEMQKWSANGTFRMALFALRNIEPGEELTYDYNFSLFNPADGQVCKCESTNCRGVIGGKSQRVSRMTTHKPSSRASSVASLHSSHSSTTSAPPQNQPITPSRVGRPRKAVKCNKKSESQRNICDLKSITLKYQQLHRLWQEPQMKPLSVKEKTIARQRHCFLLRNLEKVRRMKDRLPTLACGQLVPPPVLPAVPAPLHSRLRGRNKSARTPSTQDDAKQTGLGNVLRDIYNVLLQEKDEKKELICTSLLHCKSDKSKPSESAALVENTLCQDLSGVEAGLDSGRYKSVAIFDTDICNILSTAIKEHGRNSVQGLAALQLRKVYNSAKLEFAEQLMGILGPDESLPAGFLQKRKQEEVIMCICGLHFEEGLMVQCGGEVGGSAARGCGVWQHAHCMRVVDTTQPYLCHYCQPREVDLEIPMDEFTEDGHQFYLSLLRDSLQVRQGDTVYVLRDIPIDNARPDRSQSTPSVTQASQTPVEQVKRTERKKMKSLKESKCSDAKKVEESKSSSEVSKGGKEKEKEGVEVQKHTYKSIGDISVSELDIFRVERLWKHKETGERFVYGHHYLRPHETYHEPTRKFFQNEVMRVPLYEAVPIDLVMSQCWVMDVNTYCKGRPVGALEEHVYICELRVDRCARLFTKVSRPKYPVCTKSYAFDAFPQRLKISRTYAPHEVSPEFLKGRAKSMAQDKESKNSSKATVGTISAQKDGKEKKSAAFNQQLKRLQKPAHAQKQQKEKLNGILLGLLAKLTQAGDDKALDVSYLLEGRRQRKKISS